MGMNKDIPDSDLIWEEINTKHIIQNEWIDFRESAYRFPDGTVFEPYYSYSRRDYVVVIATDESGDYICVRQFRQGLKCVTNEFVAGGIERKDGKEYGSGRGPADAENALDAAKRELREETGYESEEWNHIITVPSNATIADNYAHIFRARNCRKITDQNLDKTEFLYVVKYSNDELQKLIEEGKFQQAVHIMGYMMSDRKAGESL